MAQTLAELKAEMEALSAEVTRNTEVDASAVLLLGRLGQIIVANAANPQLIAEIGTALTNNKGAIATSSDSLAAAIVAGTPAEG